jgi:hypothetical protein
MVKNGLSGARKIAAVIAIKSASNATLAARSVGVTNKERLLCIERA